MADPISEFTHLVAAHLRRPPGPVSTTPLLRCYPLPANSYGTIRMGIDGVDSDLVSRLCHSSMSDVEA